MSRLRGFLHERRAGRWLARRGYRIVARNVAVRGGEIDLVARDGEALVFIEVRARASGRWGSAAASVDARKRRRLCRAAAIYLAQNPTDGPIRFDVVAIDGDRVELMVDAFRPGD